jgi:hypothetical protein
MVVVVVEDFDSSQTPPPAPPANGARSVERRVEPGADAAAANGSGEKDEFDRLIALVGWVREPSRSRLWRAYLENPDGFAYIVSEALAGDKPAGLLVWFAKQGEHRHGPPRRHVQYVAIVDECAHGCGETVCIDDGESPILCLRCRRQCGYDAA